MWKRVFLSTIAAVTLTVVATPPVAFAYEGLRADFATCTRGDSNTQAKAMIAACSRLIANAKAENETVGMFYALRASVNTDKQRNCLDARKAVALIKTPNIRANAQELEKVHCTPGPRSNNGGALDTDFYAQLFCEQLWYERNAILAHRGYCFTTQRALATFGKICSPPYGKLPDNLVGMVATIKGWEQRRGCASAAIVARRAIAKLYLSSAHA